MADELKREGRYAVLRDSKGNLVTKVIAKKDDRENWRAVLRRLTNNGQDQFERLVAISMGEPFVAKLDDGRQSEPIIPTIMNQQLAAQFLIEQMHGKAVAQTEMRKAEAETKLVEQFRSMSDAELNALIFNSGEVVETERLPEGEPNVEPADTDPEAK